MNVKILFFPLSITIALLVSVFYVKPEIATVMADHAIWTEKQNIDENVAQKTQNAIDLGKDLDVNKENEAMVQRYLPDMRDDDRIIDSINFFATQSGVTLASMKIDKVAEPAAGSVPASDQAMPAPKALSVTVTAVGTYEGIRDTVARLSHMDRFQDFSTVSLDRATEAQSLGQSNVLVGTLAMNFTYLPKVSAQGNPSLPILSSNSFDFGVVQKLKQYVSATVPPMESSASGSGNPFLR